MPLLINSTYLVLFILGAYQVAVQIARSNQAEKESFLVYRFRSGLRTCGTWNCDLAAVSLDVRRCTF